jgi:hypothetical protein
MKKLGWNITAFLIMYIIATIIGFAAFFLISLAAMWLTVFILMPFVCVYLIYWYLVKIKSTIENTWRNVLILILVWIMLSFSFDALTYIFIVPKIYNIPPNWKFFIQQSPWIWICYLVLFIPGYLAGLIYLRKIK